MNPNFKKLIQSLRNRIEEDHNQFRNEYDSQWTFKSIDTYLRDEKRSDLEKAFYLILNQFPGDPKSYFVVPNEMVLIPDAYDMSGPGIEYEIDFALYGGSILDPVKVAIECDGIRSHREKHNNKDRRKDINLQAAGWIVMRFGSKEIHQELEKFEKDKLHTSDFLSVIENTIKFKLKLVTEETYCQNSIRSKLTGYKWGSVDCPHCSNWQMDILNHKNIKCRHCDKKFKRTIKPDERIAYEYGGIIFFKDETT